ncbi:MULTISPECIES: hypothetical protein [unclassified Pseudoalteromonas]|jgi:chromosome segregation ATPase|uniref:hypothetical protein n=1 Tax=unclassified Pseudoalteromonas TaxID=194690 RepID=UPI00235948D2|nr:MULTISPECIES: hypothetical protein [unclassified Pseudoalteromonas]MDC9502853.1 hypothetical protein [Pseudoalteromonas sp. Angola-18]MDC9530295.1 hypothetical protein [Pseudoalteromonas sp. Angola-7]
MLDTTKELNKESVNNFNDRTSTKTLSHSNIPIMLFNPENISSHLKLETNSSKAKDTEEFKFSSRFVEGFTQLMKAELAEQKKVIADKYKAEMDKQHEADKFYQSYIDTLKSKIRQLEELVTSATLKANNERQKRIQSEGIARKAFDELINNAATQNQLINQYEVDNNKLALKLDLINQVHKDLLREINVSTIKLEDSEQQNQMLRSENTTLRGKLTALTFEIENAKTAIKEQKSELVSLSTVHTGLEEEITRLASVESENKSEIAKLSESNAKLLRKKDSLNTAIADARTEINALNEDLDVAKARYLNFKEANIELEKENKILKASSKEPIELKGKDKLPADSIKELKVRLSAALDKVNQTNASRLELLIKVKEQADTIDLLTNKGSLLAS